MSNHLKADRTKQKAIFDRRENWILFASATIGYGVLLYLGEQQKWLVAWAATLLVFVVTAGTFHNRWSSGAFWIVMSTGLVVHMSVVWYLLAVVFRSSDGVPWIACVPFILIEAVLLAYCVKHFGDPKLLRTDEKD